MIRERSEAINQYRSSTAHIFTILEASHRGELAPAIYLSPLPNAYILLEQW